MRIDALSPRTDQRTRFARSHCVTVPEKPGCYALVTYHGEILYVGLASRSIRDRMDVHLDTESKRKGADTGVPFWFDYLVAESSVVGKIERGWMNQAVLADGVKPLLNHISSPL